MSEIESSAPADEGQKLNRRALIASAGLIGGAALGLPLAERSAHAAPPPAQPKTADDIEHFPPSPAPEDTWPGLYMLQGGKGYAPTPLGQVHYRVVGPANAPATMLLLHQSPWFMIEFGAVQNALAELGIRSVAVDTPGYGMSDQPTVLPTVGGFADNLVAVLDYLKLSRVVVGAHHTGCAIGTALAARHPTRVSGVVLHGLPLYTPEEYAERQNRKEADRSATADGSQLIKYFKGNVKMDSPGDVEVYTWLTMAGLMVGRDVGHWAINRYDFATDLKSLKMPGLIMTETEDLLHKMDLRAREMRPDFAYAVLAEKDTTGIMIHAKDWANIAAGFIHTSVK